MPEISVNIPTFNRAPFLEPCLISLCEQTLDPSRYEICVVNNLCTDNTPEVVEKIAKRYPRHRLFTVYETSVGSSAARNRGLRETSGPLVADADDDATVPPDWLERFIDRFADLPPDTGAVGGEIRPVWGKDRPDWLTDRMECFLSARTGLGDAARFLVSDECTCECNCCYRREALAGAGNFPEELGRIGTCLLSGENVVESLMKKNGWRIFFDPAITVRHFIHANRLNPLWFRQRFFWQGVSGFAVRAFQERHKVPVTEQAFLNLPLKPEDWAFLNRDTSADLEESLFLFQSLGFALALTGVLPVGDA